LRAWWLAVAAIVGLGLAGDARVWFRGIENQPGPLAAERAVVVPHGGIETVAQALAAAGLIDSVPAFRVAVWLSRGEGTLHAAEFAFPAHASLRQVLTVLRTAHPVQHLLTIPEGLTAQQIAALLNKAEVAVGTVAPPAEGSVLPQTYAYEYGTPRSVILARAEAAMQRELAADWADRAPDVHLSSPRDALILASIVERETARPDERPHVAAVYLNRLRLGMRLQADPTVAYEVSGGSGVLAHPLTRGDLDRPDPFNTYRVAGLPPGPICSPGSASLKAVLHPAASDDLYFVADGSGGHLFARTHEAHERNVAKWRALEAGRGSLE
jgi:UPF0755 protein